MSDRPDLAALVTQLENYTAEQNPADSPCPRAHDLLRSCLAALKGQTWQPIAMLTDEMKAALTVVLRPHRIHGAMDVRYIHDAEQALLTGILTKDIDWRWLNGDGTTAWADDAFLPFWMPRPAPPASTPEAQ